MNLRTLQLPVDKSWNVTWNSGAKGWTSSESCISVTYPKGGYASQSGVNFRAQPFRASKDVTLSYDVYFDQHFDFVQGGKLPGVWGGDPGSSGSDWNDKGYSCRLMWRADGVAVAYVYLCTDQGRYDGDPQNPLMRNQSASFAKAAHHTNGAGIDLWRDQGLQFEKGKWNAVKLRVVANSPQKADGSLELTVNDETKTCSGIEWSAAGMPVEGIMFASWFGGGTSDYAPRSDQHAKFRNVSYATQ